MPASTSRLVIAAVMVISAVCAGTARTLGVAYSGSAQREPVRPATCSIPSRPWSSAAPACSAAGAASPTRSSACSSWALLDQTGLDHIDIDSFLKVLIRGLILLLALVIDVYARRACAETFSPSSPSGGASQDSTST